MNIIPPHQKVGGALDQVIRISPLPNGQLRGEPMREAALDQIHDLRKSRLARSEDEVNVIRHEDVGVESVVRAVVVEGFYEELGIASDLKDAATVIADGGEKEGALRGGSLRGSHPVSLGV